MVTITVESSRTTRKRLGIYFVRNVGNWGRERGAELMIKKIKMMMMMIPVYLKGHADIGGDGMVVGSGYRKIKGDYFCSQIL